MKKIIIITLVTLILLLPAVPGCSKPDTSTTAASTTSTTTTAASPFSQEELKQITADSVAAMSGVSVYNMIMDMSTTAAPDDKAASKQDIKGNIAFDQAQHQMVMNAEMTVDDGSGTTQTQAISLYVLTEYVYMKADIPEMGETWIKMPVTEDILSSFGADIAEEQMDVMVDPESIEWVGYDTVNGEECYVLRIRPNEAYLRDFAQGQQTDTIDWEKVTDINDLFKELWYEVSIAKNTSYVQKIAFKSIIEVTGDMMASSAADFDKVVTETEGFVEIKDFNEPIDVTLPPEAENAIEISPEAFLGE